MKEIGRTILQKSQYAAKKLIALPGIRLPLPGATYFKEFVLDYGPSGKTVEEVNRALLDRKIFGGIDLTKTFPELGQAALFCVTEVHTKEQIDNLAEAMSGILVS